MASRLPSWVFIALALVLMGFALFPVVRAVLGIDQEIQMQFLTVVMFLIAGLMCGLTGMLLLVRRQPDISWTDSSANKIERDSQKQQNQAAALMHTSGLLIFTGIPLANFLVCYFLWLRKRHSSEYLDTHGREVLCQQITLYVYAMMCLFMSLLLIGVFGLLLLLAFHLIATLIASYCAWAGKIFRYPANIAIIDRRLAKG